MSVFIIMVVLGVVINIWLGLKTYSERENVQWKICLWMIPVVLVIVFADYFFVGETNDFSASNLFCWLGLSLLCWLILSFVIVFWCSQYRRTNTQKEIDENIDDVFDMAMRVGKENREGKNTSMELAEYEQKVNDLEENDYMKHHKFGE